MKVREIITEAKVEAPKPRNFVAKNAKMGGAGQHKDKKKAEKQGDVKHKNKQMAEGSVKELSMDLKTLSDAEFQAQYKMTKAQARAGLQGKEAVKETATAGSTSAGNVAVGAVYKNKKPKMQKPGTNALDMKGGNLMTGGSIKR